MAMVTRRCQRASLDALLCSAAIARAGFRRQQARSIVCSTLLSKLPKRVLDTEYSHRAVPILQAQEKVALHPTGQRVDRFDEQVLSILLEPELLKDEGAFSKAVIDRAARYLQAVETGNLEKEGYAPKVLREDVASFFTKRDGVAADPEHIVLVDGGEKAVETILRGCLADHTDGILLPLPHYPLWSITAQRVGRARAAGYFLDEADHWGMDLKEMEKAVQDISKGGGKAKAMVVVNPGNPAGQILPRADMEAILKFAEREKIILIADEAQQGCLHQLEDSPWRPFRQVAAEMNSPVEVCSLHVAGPGAWGIEGAAVHCHNPSAATVQRMQEVATTLADKGNHAGLGQALMASALSMPPEGTAAAAERLAERKRLAEAFRRKARKAQVRLDMDAGITCSLPLAGPFIYPKVIVKGHVMKKAISYGAPADQIYCMELAEREGVATMPGCGFGQRPGQFHFRLSLTQAEANVERTLSALERFHKEHPGGWFE
mmetsp:Transcript_52089/g.124035  ORF Transcript_52089/g.124035 Transcript_52089/m.124035 type:complete len:490 (+) Transcript_52089:100-1569(+)